MQQAQPDPHQNRTVEQYAAQIASSSPTPGGGSVVATVGAFAAALAEMVCNVTLIAKAPPAEPELLRKAAVDGERLRLRLLELSRQDEAAYAGYQAASRLPRSSDTEKQARREALDRALVVSADVPLEIARAGAEVLELLLIPARHGTKHALSDVSTGAVLAEAAVRGALLTVRVNAELMRDPDQQSRYLAELTSLTQQAHDATAAVLDAVEERSHAQ
jgi:formiminotetrahydrofolate cyclodeaminase